MVDFAIVGGGVGGLLSATALSKRGYSVTLLEQDRNLGGSSGTFKRGKYRFNTGATTFAGYMRGTSLHSLINETGVSLPIEEIDPALTVIQGNHSTDRYRDLDMALHEIEKSYPHNKNREFWSLVYRVNRDFYSYNDYHYSGKNLFHKISSMVSFIPLAYKFKKLLFQNGEKFIREFFSEISEEYLNFLDAQILIVAQSRSRDLNALVTLLSLGYTSLPNYYVRGGMGEIFNSLSNNIDDVRLKHKVANIDKIEDGYRVYIDGKKSIDARNIVLNSTIFDTPRLFSDREISGYYSHFKNLNNSQSAYVLYGVVATDVKLNHHYQIIVDEVIENTISNAIFISFSDIDDRLSAPEGERTFTISIHTDIEFWSGLDSHSYKDRDKKLQERIIDILVEQLSIKRDEIRDIFSANPRTFRNYIGREQLGGVSMSNNFYNIPSNITPFQGLYHVGDSTFPAQGWLGVATGVQNFLRSLH